MDIHPANYSYNYKYDYYLKIYDSNGNQKINQRYYSTSSKYWETYSVGSTELNPGNYTIKIINCYDGHVMDTANLTVIALTSDVYSVNISDTIITYNVGGGIIMNITPLSSIYDYKYDYYLKVFDSNGNQKINQRYYSVNSDTQIIYSISFALLPCGNYIIKLVNYYDNKVMSAANLYVVSVPHEAYSISINNTKLNYGFSGSIIMNITPANSSYDYKYDYYLKVYDSNDNEKISQRYHSTNSNYQENYSFSYSYLTPGMYTIKILNNIDNYIMSTANLTVIALTSDAYSVNISDITIDYGKSGSIIMNIVPANSSYDYKYDYYLKIYDSNGNQKINQRYYNTDSISPANYYINSTQLDPGNYTMKIINRYDYNVMSTAKLTVISIPYSVYSVNVSDIRMNYGNKGFISMSISPTSGYYYKYDFYLKIYDSEGYEEISKRYYSTSSSSQITYLLDPTELSPGIYTIKIINNVDDHVMSTARLYVLSSPEFELFSQDYFVDEIVEIDYNIDPDATGTVSVYINGILIKNVSAGRNIELGYMPFGNYTIKVIYDGDDYYYGQEDSTTFEVHRHCSTLILSVNNITVTNHDFETDIVAGTDVILQFRFNEDINGKINVIHGSDFGYESNYTLNLINGNVNLPISNITRDYHLFTITYAGDDKYLPFYAEYGLIFNPKQSYINYTIPDNLFWGDSFIIDPILPEDATGEIDITIYDENGYHFNYSMNVNSTYNMTVYNGGYNYLALHYYGDEYYGNSDYLKEFNVAKLDTAFSITDNIEAGFSTINVTLNEDATGTISLYLDYNTYPGTLKNGSYVFTIPDIKVGNYTVHIHYGGDSKYNPFIEYKPLKVNLKKTNLNLDLKNILWYSNATINPTISEGATGYIDIYVDDIFKQTIDVGSSYVLTYPNKGKHEVKIIYSGDDYFQSCENMTSFWVFTKYPIKAEDTYILFNTHNYFKAMFFDEFYAPLNNKYVLFNVDGNDYVRLTDIYGYAILDIDLDIGIYNVTSINPIYNENMTNKLVVFSSVQSENLTRAYNSGADFNATFLDGKAKPLSNTYVVFKVNGTDYTVKTNMYGQAVLNQGLAVGTYEVISINTYTSENKTNYLTIVPSIQAEDMLRAYNSTMDYCATFTCANNTPLSNTTVTFEIGSNRYEVSTDENGVAILNVPLAVGEYNITATNPVTGEKSTKNLTIVERIINNTNIVLSTDSEDYFGVVVIGDNGTVCKSNETVVFTLNNTNYNVKTDEYGYASLLISSLDKGLYQINTTYKGFTVSNNITVFEDLESIISIEAVDVNYTEKVCFNVSVSPEYRYGNLTIDIISNYETLFEFNATANETFTKELCGLNASYYVIAVKFVDMDNYYTSQDVLTFEVLKINPKLIVVIDDAEYGQNATITINIPKVSGNVTIRVGDEKNFTEYMPKDGVIIKRFNDLVAGEYDVIVTYEGNNNYNSLTKVSKLNINKIPTYIWLDSQEEYDYGQTITVNLMSSADGVVKVEFGEDIKFIDVKANKIYQSNYSNCHVGVYLAAASLIPSEDNYDNSSTDTTIVVTKADTTISAPDVTVTYLDEGELVATLTNEYGKVLTSANLVVNLNGMDYALKTNSKGQVKVSTSGLAVGNYIATISYAGNNKYNPSTATAKVIVGKGNVEISAENVYVTYLDDGELVATLINVQGKVLSGDIVLVNLNGVDYALKTDSKGQVKVSTSDLTPKTYVATISYAGNSKYNPSSVTANVVVSKAATSISAIDDGEELVATLTNEYGKALSSANVMVNINGVDYALKTNSKGQAKLSKSDLEIGTYNATVSYAGNNKYNPSNASVVITVKSGTNLAAPDVNVVYRDEFGMLVATLTNAQGKALTSANVVVNLNGMDYALKTNSKGQVKVSTSDLTPKTYVATISYAGNSKYKPSSATANVVVTKAATSISAIDDGENLVATLTNEYGQALVSANVVVNLNGVDYALKTNSKGQVKVSIADLDSKDYAATFSYAGNGKYFAAAVTINAAEGKTTTSISTVYSKETDELITTLTNTATGNGIKGAKVVVKINGVKNSLTTNTYTIISSYAGNSKYTATSKTETTFIKN